MADLKIGQLTQSKTIDGALKFPVSNSAGVTEKVTLSDIGTYVSKNIIPAEDNKVDKTDIVQKYGNATDKIMSQNAVSSYVTTKIKNISKGSNTTYGIVKGGNSLNIVSGVIDVKDNSHNHTIANVSGLEGKLNNKLNSSDAVGKKYAKSEGGEVFNLYGKTQSINAPNGYFSGNDASGAFSHAEGIETIAAGNYSHAEGEYNISNGEASHVEGIANITENDGEHAEGIMNVSHNGDTTNLKTISSIGVGDNSGGVDDLLRKNALEVMRNGDVYILNVGNYNGATFNTNTQTLQTVLNLKADADHNHNQTYQKLLKPGTGIDIINGHTIKLSDSVETTLNTVSPTIIYHYPPIIDDMQNIVDSIIAHKKIKFINNDVNDTKEYVAFGEFFQTSNNYELASINLDNSNAITRYKFINDNSNRTLSIESVTKTAQVKLFSIIGTKCFEYRNGKFSIYLANINKQGYNSYNIKQCEISGNSGWVGIDLEFSDITGVNLNSITPGMIVFQQLDAYNETIHDGHKTMPNMNISTIRVTNNQIHIGASPTIPERSNTNLFRFSITIFAEKIINMLV